MDAGDLAPPGVKVEARGWKGEVALRGDIWWRYGNSVVESDSFLLTAGVLDVVGKEVAIVKQGFIRQALAQRLPLREPQWTSFALRQQQEVAFSRVGSQHNSGGCVGMLPFQQVEFARVTDVEFLCRIPADWQRADVAALVSGQMLFNSQRRPAAVYPFLDETSLTMWTDAKGFVHTCSEMDGLFARLTVQQVHFSGRHGTGARRLRPYVSHVDFYLRAGYDFIVEHKRYRIAMQRRWEAGHCVKMFWADADDVSRGEYYTGTIESIVQHHRSSPLSDSPWECIQVAWDEDAGSTLVNAWEIVPAAHAMPTESGALGSIPSNVQELLVSDDDGGDDTQSDDSVAWEHQRRKRRKREAALGADRARGTRNT